MGRICKVLLLIEVVVCFGPMTVLLLMGALLVPMQIVALFIEEERHWDGAIEVFGSVGCGVIGLATLVVLLSRLVDGPATKMKRPWFVFAGAIIGAIPLIDALASDIVAWRVLGAMPIVAGLHVLFLSRSVLFPTRGREPTEPDSKRLPARTRCS